MNTRNILTLAQTAGKEDRTFLTPEVSELQTGQNMQYNFLLYFFLLGEQEIKSLKVKCNNSENGCGWVGELQSLNDHLTTCEYTLLHCQNECTKEERLLRCDLDDHLKNKCPNRQYQCPHCKDTGRYCDITTTHLDTCPKVKIPCLNSECKALVFRCDLADHQSKCPFEKVPCKYAGIGCKEEPLRKDLLQHEDDDTFHLRLAVETINKQQKKINDLQETKADKEEQKDNIMAGHADPCVFNMPEFSRHKSSKREWYSPSFCTHPGGYKICIRVDANGCGDAAGTHVSVFPYLMRGKNDDNLPWPFREEVTITLLNQLADENHYTCTVSFPTDHETSRRVVRGERAPRGYGWSKFISHNKLDYDAARYLKEDCLCFRIEVKAPEPVKPWLTCTV